MHVEIERKWRIESDRIPDLVALKAVAVKIRQGYLSSADSGAEVRLRQLGDQYVQTVKGTGDLVRSEFEANISREIFEIFWPATLHARVEKTRYSIHLTGQNRIIELDIYSGDLAGLVIAEVEFPDVNASENFVVPDWFGLEVTDDKRFKNKNLAVSGFPQSLPQAS